MNQTFSVSPDGVFTVDTSVIQNAFIEAYKQALGSDLNTEAGTPQGQMIINDTATLTTAMNQVVNIANSFSPYYATGAELDTVGAFFGYYRKTGIGTVVFATFTGTAGTIIPQGTIVSDGTYEYATLARAEVLMTGSVIVECQNTTAGAIPCAAGALNEIITQVAGIESVKNTNAGIQGYLTETDNEFRQRITRNWLNKRARSILGALWDNLAALDGVRDVLCRENQTSVPLQIDDQLLQPHSVYVCNIGGNGTEIAQVISQQKTLGAGVNGNTEVSWTDTALALEYKYLVQRPAEISISVQVEYSNNAFTQTGVENQIKQLLSDWVAQNPFKIGEIVSGAELANAFNNFDQANILAVKVQIGSGENWQDYIKTTISQVAILSDENITIKKAE